MRFDPLQQVSGLQVGVTVMAVFDARAFTEQRIRFVEQQHCALFFGGVENCLQVLFRFADVLARDAVRLDPVEGQTEVVGKRCCSSAAYGGTG